VDVGGDGAGVARFKLFPLRSEADRGDVGGDVRGGRFYYYFTVDVVLLFMFFFTVDVGGDGVWVAWDRVGQFDDPVAVTPHTPVQERDLYYLRILKYTR